MENSALIDATAAHVKRVLEGDSSGHDSGGISTAYGRWQFGLRTLKALIFRWFSSLPYSTTSLIGSYMTGTAPLGRNEHERG